MNVDDLQYHCSEPVFQYLKELDAKLQPILKDFEAFKAGPIAPAPDPQEPGV